MCGVFGVYYFSEKKNIDLKRVSNALRLRGPDAEGYYSDNFIDFVHRRLSIIDISERGNQPLFNKEKTKCIVFNGEIFNYKELKKNYLSDYSFHSESDTEVILYLYEKFGKKCVDKLNGNFAFAIWDILKRELFIARDRLGTRPLYYYQDKDCFIFSSEMRGIFATDLVKEEFSDAGIIEYFAFQNFFGEETIYRNIKIVPPATTVTVRGNNVSKETYWDAVFTYTEDKGKDYYKEKLKYILEQSIQRQLVRDPEIFLGSYLSGGIDSGSIVAFTSKYISHLLTFTCGWNMSCVDTFEADFDERRMAEKVASYFKTTHHEIVLNHGDMEWMASRVARVLEEPRMGMSYSNHYIARLASKFVKICFSGTGGDELFGGYNWRYNLVKDIPVSDERSFDDVYYNYWLRLVPEKDRMSFFNEDFLKKNKNHFDLPFERYRSVFQNTQQEFRNSTDKALYFDLKTFLHGLLVIEDKTSMNYGMETRVPLLDNELVDFALALPTHYKINGQQGKILLREIVADLLPPEVAELRKQGFSSPDQAWYQADSFEFVYNNVLGVETPYFNKDFLEKVIETHRKGEVNHRLLIWSLLNFNLMSTSLYPQKHRGLVYKNRVTASNKLLKDET